MKIEDVIVKLNEAKSLINECLVAIGSDQTRGDNKPKTTKHTRRDIVKSNRKLVLSVNERAFVKANVEGLSSAKKFVLLIAHETKGKIGVDVDLELIRTKWNRMTSKDLLGVKFNRKYTTEAKTNGWVNSTKTGQYHLVEGWEDIFN